MGRALTNRLRSDDHASATVEYGMMVAIIAAVTVVVVVALGSSVQPGFQTMSDDLGGGFQPAAREVSPSPDPTIKRRP